MAGLFSLGRTEEENQQSNNPTTEFWYNKNDDSVVSSYRGFEIWNQHPHHQQQQQQLFSLQQPQQQDLYSSGVVLGVGPTRVCSSDENRSAVFVGSGSGSVGISCQDCGNQAKKDCPHMRCRTCCKSRGFDCQTHVKSTWVPAARRRERQQLSAPKSSQQHGDIVPETRHRDLNNNNSSLACTRLPTNPSLTLPSAGLLEEMNFPAVVNSPAEFRCVRVSSVDENEEEYAYSTAVNIGGHVFRGILYDYGPDHGNNNNNSYNMAAGNASNSSGTALEGVVEPLNLISGVPATGVEEIVDPSSSLYPAPLNTFMPSSGTQFFPHPRS